jgi:hypothetical protein
MQRLVRPFCALLLGAASSAASAQMTPISSAAADAVGPWRYSASLYLYVPSVSGKTRVPVDDGGTTLNFDILEHLKFTFMGSLDAHNGQWGAFTDFIYLDFKGNRNETRKFTIGDAGLPAGTTADIDWKLKGTSWTLAGQYRIVSGSTVTLDALAGARVLDIKRSSDWTITGDLGPLPPTSATGSRKDSTTLLDGILGVRGRASFGPGSPWSVPFYFDIGGGESKRTWQAAAGIRYAFAWGEVSGLWRVLDYDLKSGDPVEKIRFYGPLVGATWRW